MIKVAVRVRPPSAAGKQQDDAKILALIANVENGIEEAALLCGTDRSSPHLPKRRLVTDAPVAVLDTRQSTIEGVVPIYADFEVAFEQVETGSVASLENAGQPVQASFRAKFLANGAKYSFSAVTADLTILEDILKETRRLTEIAGRSL